MGADAGEDRRIPEGPPESAETGTQARCTD